MAKASKVMSEGQFVATVAHELKAPLHTMQTIAHSARNGMWGRAPKNLAVQLGRMELSARRMLELADSLLRLEQVQSGRLSPQIQPLRVDQLIADIRPVLQPFLDERKQSIECRLRRTHTSALADPLYARHALLNILLNAAKYSPPHSSLEIICRETTEGLCIEVHDQAVSLGTVGRKQVASSVPLAVYDRKATGYGMGIFIATRFVESCGGRLEYHQRRQGGNRFILCLPLARQLALFPDEEVV